MSEVQAGQGKQFYNVADFIQDLAAGRFGALEQQVNKPVDRVPLTTPVMLCNGVLAAICEYNPNDSTRYQVTWFDHRQWAVRFKWLSREDFEVVEAANHAADASTSAAQFA